MALASLSSARPCRNAARRPRATPSAKASSDDDSASTRLLASASRTSRITARRVAIDFPRSPCATRPSQTRYCTGSGLSKPYARLVASISAWLDSAGIPSAIGSPGARGTIAKTMMLAPSSVGIASSRRRPTYAHTSPTLLHRDGRQVHEPALGLHEALHLGRQRPGILVVHDEDPRRVVHDDLVQLGQRLVLLADVKGALGLLDQLVGFGIDVGHRVDRDGHDGLAVEEASEAAPRLEKVPRDVPRVETLVVRGVEARAPAREQRVPLHRLQVDVDADVLEVLLDQLVHGQRQHLARARRRDEVHRLRGMLARVEAGLAQQLLGLGRVVAVRLLRLAEPRMTFVDDARGGNARVVEQALADAHTIQRIILGPADEPAVPPLLVQPQRVRPVLRVGGLRGLEARALWLRGGGPRPHLH